MLIRKKMNDFKKKKKLIFYEPIYNINYVKQFFVY